MRLTEKEILALVNVLFWYKTTVDGNVSPLINSLIEKLESVLVAESGDDDESDEGEDEADDPEVDGSYSADDYHKLAALYRSGDEIEFENNDGVISLIVDGDSEIEEVLCVKRTSDKSFEVWDGVEKSWVTYEVDKFSKAWKDKFQLNKVYGVL